MQGVVDAVGEKVREIFDAQTIYIALLDRETNTIHFPYYREGDQPFLEEPRALGKGLTSIVIQARRTLVFGTLQEQIDLGAVIVEPACHSYLGVPLISGEEAIGVMSVQSYREHAFAESDVALLSTLATGTGVALENARLFAETRRLLAETDQRAAALATVNAVSQALASELDLDALLALTGEQVRRTFAADIVYVSLLDRQTNTIHFPYIHGENLGTMTLGEGLSSRVIVTGEPLLINEDIAGRHAALEIQPVGVQAKSYLGVPIVAGDETIGVLSAQSVKAEGRFDEHHLRLLSTIAANVGVAIENARLFQAAQDAQAAAEQINTANSTFLATDIRIGVTLGQMRAGAYGGASQRAYGVQGDKTNLAALIMQAAADGILCDEAIYRAAKSAIAFEAMPAARVKGSANPVAVYRPVAKSPRGAVAARSRRGSTTCRQRTNSSSRSRASSVAPSRRER